MDVFQIIFHDLGNCKKEGKLNKKSYKYKDIKAH